MAEMSSCYLKLKVCFVLEKRVGSWYVYKLADLMGYVACSDVYTEKPREQPLNFLLYMPYIVKTYNSKVWCLSCGCG